MPIRKSIVFASDLHLGLHTNESPQIREQRIVSWLRYIRPHTEELFLLGDTFDFWFEYRHVAPKGHIRFLASLAEFTDSGIPVHILTGNHDVWLFGYLPNEIGVDILHGPLSIFRYGRRLYICHGDEVGYHPFQYRTMRALFHSRIAQRIFAWGLHPDIAHSIGYGWSHRNRQAKPIARSFRGNAEPIVQFAAGNNLNDRHDLYLAGHLHTPTIHPIENNAYVTILGDWIVSFTYAIWNGESFSLMRYAPNAAPEILNSVQLHDL